MKLMLLILIFSFFNISCAQSFDWRTAPRDSAGIAPNPIETEEAIVQVYAARTVRWRGYFAVHSWIATKNKNEKEYTTYHVIGWRVRRGQSAVVIEKDIPDRLWYGERPELISELRGEIAERAIPKIQAAAESYPYPNKYSAWPGPNSNTFISHIIRSVPEFKVELPPHAIGRDWIHDGDLLGLSETKTGVQVSLYGALGFTVGLRDGFEMNLFGLTFGFDVLRPAIKLPMVGRVGFKDSAAP